MLETLNSYTWNGPNGIRDLKFLVIQNRNTIDIIDTSISPFSDGVIYSEVFGGLSEETPTFSFTTVDGKLLAVYGDSDILIYSYDSGVITKETGRIKTRDFFGVSDLYSGKDLTEGLGLIVRPSTATDNHVYNLRNQSWGPSRDSLGGPVVDTIAKYYSLYGEYPSNADNVNYGLAKNPAGSSPTVDQLDFKQIESNPPGTFRAPMGYFIIDAIDRGASRVEQYANLIDEDSVLSFKTITLPGDRTAGGATCVQEYAGRVFYAGFSSEVIDGDSKSPRLGSYIFYSKLAETSSDIFKCYQDGDPTSNDTPDLLDTDGGFIRISSANNIVRMENVGSGLLVIAENGVWIISGGSGYGFSANNNLVTKVTERGSRYQNSVVVVDNTVMYWSEDGIYHVKQNQYGDWVSESLSESTIQTFYEGIPEEDKLSASASYDSFDKKVRWVYQNRLGQEQSSKELVLDLGLGAFYPNNIETLDGYYPKVCSAITIPPNRLEFIQEGVVVGGVPVVVGAEDVVMSRRIDINSIRETAYLVAFGDTVLSGGAQVYPYGFCGYLDPEFKDWRDFDEVGEGVDAQAYLVTGYMSGGDFSRKKQVPYITFYFDRTEDGFVEVDGDWVPTNQSSCMVQSQWSWNNSAANGKWGTPFQAYRYRRLYSPSSLADNFDSGEEVIVTKNKLRGSGNVLSLKIYSEPEKNLVLYGWSMSLDVNANV